MVDLVRILFGAGMLVMPPPPVHAAETTIRISATVLEVQCTAEQRARIRACAPAHEAFTLEPSKKVIAAGVEGGSLPGAIRYEVALDPTRPVLIRTVLY